MPDHDDHDDHYAANAEFFDIFMAEAWVHQGPALAAALNGAGAAGAPIIDVGAGTGLSTRVIAEAVRDVPIVAVEPSPALRPMLFSRLRGNADLQKRVTVRPETLQSARLPPRFGGVVAANMLGHLTPEQRRAFWRLLATRLEPGAPAVIGLLPPTRVEAVPESTYGPIQIGDRTYVESAWAEPAGPETIRWHMALRVTEGGTVVEERTFEEGRWWPVGLSDLEAEVAEVAGLGLTVRPADPPYVVVGRRTHDDR